MLSTSLKEKTHYTIILKSAFIQTKTSSVHLNTRKNFCMIRYTSAATDTTQGMHYRTVLVEIKVITD